ncbi:MAG: hypothetical protein HC794_08510 [Nitrospiraceae bacterium]|nr:hypothetical protein [Nitrospiraceae bacterium]
MTFYAFGGESEAVASVTGWLFEDGADDYVRREQAGWKDWLENLAVTSA